MTSFRNLKAPTPLNEADNLLDRSRNVFYEAILDLEEQIDLILRQDRPINPMIELGFWPGGDRDGNPYVDIQTTLQVAKELKECCLKHYCQEIHKLKKRLTFPGMSELLANIEKRLEKYENSKQLIADIDALREQVVKNYQSLFLEKIDRFKLAVRTFGFYFASLDIRQDSSVHEEVVTEILKKLALELPSTEKCHSYDSLSPNEKIDLLETICIESKSSFRDLSIDKPDLAKDVIGSLKAFKTIQSSNGVQGLHRYIISHCMEAHHVFEIYFLVQILGLKEIEIDIVPLFETVADLKNSEKVMERLFSSKIYKTHLQKRKGIQIIMVGFSDGTKDGGYLTCNWEIFKAKSRLEKIGQKYGVDIVFFDGRGGPPARGGGNSHKFYRALGASLEQQEVQLTIQGQTISSLFGCIASAHFNLEQIFTSGIEGKLLSKTEEILTEEESILINQLSEKSYSAYIELREDPSFLSFLQEMTPLAYFGKLNVASRPAKRGRKKKLLLKDLRAIPFVGAWNQIKLNVPGFYGLGTALKWAFENEKKEAVIKLYREKLYFSTLIDNAMQSLAKSNELYTKPFLKDKTYGPFLQKLHNEIISTKKYLLELSNQKKLLENDPLVQQSIKIREELILPLVVIQQYVMFMLKTCTNKKEKIALEKLLLKTLPAITNAGRNSA